MSPLAGDPGPDAVPDEVLARAAASSEEAMRLLVERYRRQVMGYFLGWGVGVGDADELTVDTFFAAWTSLRTTQVQRFQPWLWTIARRQYAAFVKRRTSERALIEPFADGREPGDEDFAHVLRTREMSASYAWFADLVTDALDSIPENYQRVLRASIPNDQVGAELAEQLGIPRQRVNEWRSEGLEQLLNAVLLLLLVRGRSSCAKLRQLAADVPTTGPLPQDLRNTLNRHVGHCGLCLAERKRLNGTRAFLPVLVPWVVAPDLWERLRAQMAAAVLPPPPVAPLPPPALPRPPAPGAGPPLSGRPPGRTDTWSRPAGRDARRPHRGRRGTAVALVLGVLALLVLVIAGRRWVIDSGPPEAAQPVQLSAAPPDCRFRIFTFASCFSEADPVSDGSNPLDRLLLDGGEGGVDEVKRRYSALVRPSTEALRVTDLPPSPLPRQCYETAPDRNAWQVLGPAAVETVTVDGAPAELGVLRLDLTAARQLAEEISSPMRSCYGLSITGRSFSVEDDTAAVPETWMHAVTVRNVGSDGVRMQYSLYGVRGDRYVYVTAYDQQVAQRLAAALADKLSR